MTKQELTKQMQQFVGGLFATRKQIADLMGYKDPRIIDKYLIDLQRVNSKYLISEVAEKLVEGSTRW